MRKEKKTLCILTDIFTVGGIESVIIDSLPALTHNYNVTLHVLTDNVDRSMMQRLPANVEVKTSSFQWSYWNELRIQLPFVSTIFFRHILKNHYDTLIVIKPSFINAGLAKTANRNIYWNHTTQYVNYIDSKQLDFLHRLNLLRLRHIFSHYDEIWQINDYVNSIYESAFRLKNCRMLYNPLDSKNILRLADEKVSDFIVPKNHIVIVIVGRLSFEKGIDRVIKALSRLSSDLLFKIYIIGDGPEKIKLEKFVLSKQLNNHIIFLGSKNNPYPYVKYADWVFCPSREESFGLVPLEAMLLQTPVIATDTLGFRQVTQNGQYGILIDNTDNCISSVLEELLKGNFKCDYSLDDAMKWALSFDKNSFLQQLSMYLDKK